MKLVTFAPPSRDADPRAGLLRDDYVVDLAVAAKAARRSGLRLPDALERIPAVPSAMRDLLALGPSVLNSLESIAQALVQKRNGNPGGIPWAFRVEDVALKAPLPEPHSIRDFYAFEEHVRRARAQRGLDMPPEWYEFPVFYFSNTSAIYGPNETVPYPSYSSALDYEMEVACVIGKTGIDIPETEADEYIAGYTIMNDWSARDVQRKEMRVGLGPAKGKDFATSLGPWFVTPDDLASKRRGKGRYDLEMTARVNGVVYSRGNLKDIYWTFAQMIARASQDVYLRPGDVIGSGTVSTGCILELGPEKYGWLKPGDRVELEVEGLGRLVNTVAPARKGR